MELLFMLAQISILPFKNSEAGTVTKMGQLELKGLIFYIESIFYFY